MSYGSEQIARELTFVEGDAFTAERYRLFARELGQAFSGDVLDVGCGAGVGGAAFHAAHPGAKLDGNELLSERIDRVPQGVYREVIPGLLQDITFDRSYDVVLAGEVVEHIPLAFFDDFLVAVHRNLKTGGHFLLTTPNPHYILLKRRSRGTVLGGAHVSVHCPATLTQYLNANGFVVTKTKGSGKMTRLLGRHAPAFLYGAFFVHAVKR